MRQGTPERQREKLSRERETDSICPLAECLHLFLSSKLPALLTVPIKPVPEEAISARAWSPHLLTQGKISKL